MKDHIVSALSEAKTYLEALLSDEIKLGSIETAAEILIQTFKEKRRVFSCGNGGSMCDAMHFAEELTGRFRKNRSGLAAVSISDPGHISCVANDFGYDAVFARYLESHAQKGDCLLAISTSGTSKNVIKAVQLAKTFPMHVISLTGQPNSFLGGLADVDLCIPCGQYADRVQEIHIKIIHILIELVERALFPKIYE